VCGIDEIIKSDVPIDVGQLLSKVRNIHYRKGDDEGFAASVKVKIA
jgi:hypothetical protein